MVYRPTARVLTVLELLQTHGRMTGAELARRLEVNIRTVRDYIQMLGDLGIPVEAVRGRYGAYRLRPGYKLPPLIFTEDEALALTLSLLMAREHELAQTSPAFEGALTKIERVLPTTTREHVQAVEQTVIIESDAYRAAPALAVVTILSSAVHRRRCVCLGYRSARAETTKRTFSPYGIMAHEGVWYTIGYCHLRQSQRLLRLDRITRAALTDETFPSPENFDMRGAVLRSLASVPRVWQVEVWLEATLEEARRKSQLTQGHFTEGNGGVLLRVEVEDLQWMARLLAGIGLPFTIHHPPELRTALRQHAQTMLDYAERTP
ncbi:transcriptional regulator [Dictyobacter sp. S3.2.2.5]|uniref:Transcriptional regulator n=1 Tax=Dictyobacter halimunensis TaxID=3026934 RepID=A0ABQ6FPG4_9CHLR|nr:transcriptional regulator [Dictyobacter sp. S3.2.2.5]